MTTTEALALIDATPLSSKPARINPGLTRAQALDIVRVSIASDKVKRAVAGGRANMVVNSDGTLTPLFEKRVLQVVRNQIRPRMSRKGA